MKSVSELLSQIRPEFSFDGVEDFFEAGMLDSFDLVTLVSELDRQYQISIDGTDIVPENFRNISAILALLRKHGIST